MSDAAPATDDRHPAQIIENTVAHALRLAQTWPAWDGQPVAVADRVYTPHKAIRRLADHLLDHLAELEARLAGQSPCPTTGTPPLSQPRPTSLPSPPRIWTRRAAG